ncbi:MAG: VOC family protein [Pseudohongiella sp.]|nr:MAG: VOC family protein [Pseudohongiella sp.]
MQLTSHLSFSGNCEEAFSFYREIFDGELSLVRFEDTPAAQQVQQSWRSKVVHCTLVSGDIRFCGADVLPEQYEAPQGVFMLLEPDTVAQAQALFQSLSEGGKVTMPLAETFWSPAFGMITDRFGITWEFSCAGEGEAA